MLGLIKLVNKAFLCSKVRKISAFRIFILTGVFAGNIYNKNIDDARPRYSRLFRGLSTKVFKYYFHDGQDPQRNYLPGISIIVFTGFIVCKYL